MSDAKHAPKTDREPRRLVPRAETVIAGMVVVMGGGIALLAVQYVGMHQDLETANKARDALASQVQHLGASPVAGPPGSRGEPGQSIVGPRGPQGPAGASGKPAPTITGPSGASGVPGKDSTVAGPSGPPGPSSTVAGPSGPPGPAGQNGVNGTDGKDGTNGQPPEGWTYTWTDGTGTTHTVTCTRASNFDPSSPQYECSDTASSPSPAPLNPHAGLLLLSAVLKRRRGHAGSREAAVEPRAFGRHRAGGRRGGSHR